MIKKIWKKLFHKCKKKIILGVFLILITFIVVPHITYQVDYIFDKAAKLQKSNDIFTLPKYFIVKENISSNNYGEFFNFDSSIEVFSIALISFIFFILIISIVFDILSPSEKYESAVDYDSHGSSRWLDNNELKKNFYNDQKGWWVGAIEEKSFNLGTDGVYLAFDNTTGLNSQVIVFGSPNSKKSTSLIIPNILNSCHQYIHNKNSPDIIVTDPKSELWKHTNNFLEKNGYDVFVLDFINLNSGHSLNPIDFINDDISLREICKNYISSMGGETKDMQWQNFEYLVLGSLVGFVQQIDDCQKTFYEVFKILKSENVSSKENAKAFFEKYKIKDTPLELWEAFLMGLDSPKTISSILIGLAEKMSIFADKGIRKITNTTTLPIENLGVKKDKPMALFIFTPDSNNTFRAIINMVVSTVLSQLYKTSYKYNGTLQVPVHLFLDEMANIGNIPRIEEMLGTMRGRKIYPMMILQSLSQLKQRYPNSWEDILSQCDTSILLGVNDVFTSEYFSKLIGKTTIKIKSTSKKAESGILDNSNERDSDQYQSRELLQPNEISRFDNDYLIMIRRSTFPSKIRKVQYKFWETPIAEESKIESIIKLPDLDNSIKSFLEIQATKKERKHVNIFEMKKQATIIHKLARTAFKNDNKELIEKFENEITNRKELFTVTKDYDGKFLDIDNNLIDNLYQAYVKNDNEKINEVLNNIDKHLEKINEAQENLNNLEFEM